MVDNRAMDSSPMVNACYRHQCPEAFGGNEVGDACVPVNLRYGNDRTPVSREVLDEEIVGDRTLQPITDQDAELERAWLEREIQERAERQVMEEARDRAPQRN